MSYLLFSSKVFKRFLFLCVYGQIMLKEVSPTITHSVS